MLDKIHGEAATFWKEATDKETALRFKWLETYQAECAKSVTKTQERMKERKQLRQSTRATSTTGRTLPSSACSSAPSSSSSSTSANRSTTKKDLITAVQAARAVREVCAERKSITLPEISPPRSLVETRRLAMAAALAATAPRPISSRMRETLYQGISKEGGGRTKYLKLRNGMSLEERYSVPQTTTQAMSFNMHTIMPNAAQAPAYGRRNVIQPSFYRKEGVPLSALEH